MRPWVAAASGAVVVVGFLFWFGGVLGFADARLDLLNLAMPAYASIVGACGLAVFLLRPRNRLTQVVVGLALCVTILAGTPVAVEFISGLGGRLGSPIGRPGDLRLLSLNLWDANPDINGSEAAILRSDADVVTLQEALKLHISASPEFRRRYPYKATCATSWGCEIVIFSKTPIRASGSLSTGDRSDIGGLWLVWVDVVAPDDRPVRIVSTHLAHPDRDRDQPRQWRVLQAYLGALSGGSDRLILTGDFNTTPWSYSLRSNEGRLRPLTRRTHAVYTWPRARTSIVPAPFPLLPLDQLFAGPDWKTVSVRRLKTPSDHYGVLAVFRSVQRVQAR